MMCEVDARSLSGRRRVDKFKKKIILHLPSVSRNSRSLRKTEIPEKDGRDAANPDVRSAAFASQSALASRHSHFITPWSQGDVTPSTRGCPRLPRLRLCSPLCLTGLCPLSHEATPHLPTKSGWQTQPHASPSLLERMNPLFAGLITQCGSLLAMYLSAYDTVIFRSKAMSVVP